MNPEQSRPGLKTWSALLGSRRRPSEYEVVSYKLHYRNRNRDAPYEQSPDLPMNQWYRKYVFDSPLRHPDWDAFRDPDEVTYRAYCIMQDGQEQYVDGLLNNHDANGHDAGLSDEWVGVLARLYTPARYALAALQMASAYLVQMAPASTITNCAVFHEADQFRWLSRTAYRTRELANAHPGRGFAERERQMWEQAPEWQGFRALLEKVLATFDWGESFVALNVVAARAFDAAFLHQLAAAARAQDDSLTAMLCDNQGRDSQRAVRWTEALVRMCLVQDGNREVIEGWLQKWIPLSDAATDAFCLTLPNGAAAAARARAETADFRRHLGFEKPSCS
jgi:toluene monooxygenase system protein E